MPDQAADEYVVSDPELITRVRAGDRQAFGELYKRHSGPATSLARQFARSAAESDDLVSESFARVLDNLLAGKGPDTAFRAYLFTTVRNTAYDRTRKDKRLQFTDDMTTHDVAVVGDDPVLAKMESGLVATAFAQLPERWQAVLWHTQVEGETPAQVGALLGMAPGAVSSLAFRAREGLREAYLQAHLAETAAEKCRSTVDRLGAWTRGGLSKREQAQVEAHLEECDRCRALAAELEEVNHGLRGLLAPLLLGGAAAGYLATLGPVAPLVAPGALAAGAAGAGSGTAGSAGAGGTGAGAAGGAGAAAGGSTAATAAGVAAGAAAIAAGAVGAAALASASAGGAGTAAAAGTAGAAAAGGGAGGGGAGGAGAGGAAGGAGAAAGAGGVFAGLGVGGLVAAGAVLVAAAVAAVFFIVSGNSPEATNTASTDGPSVAAPATPGNAGGTGGTGGTSGGTSGGTNPAAGNSAQAAPGANTAAATAGDGTGDSGTGAGGTGGTGGAGAGGTGDGGTGDGGAGAGGTGDGGTGDGGTGTGGGTGNGTEPGSTPPVVDPIVPGGPNGTTPTGPSTTTEPTTTPTTPTTPTTNPPPAPLLGVSNVNAPALNAGGTGTLSFTVTNTGDAASAETEMSIGLPTGVQVIDAVQGSSPPAGLRRAGLGLLRAGPCVSQTDTNCTLLLQEVPVGGSLTLTLTLAAETSASGGTVVVTALNQQIASFELTVNAPAALDLLNPQITKSPVAGGTGAFTVTVRNTGGQPSTGGEPVTIDLPDGFTPQQILVGGQPCSTAGEAARVAVDCALPTIEPGADVLITVDLRVAPGTKVGTATVSIPNTGPLSLTLTVQPGITGLAGEAQGPLVADGQAHNIVVTATTADSSVTNPGTITFTTATTPGVTFQNNEDCSVNEGGSTAECDLFGDNKLLLTVVIGTDTPTGPLLIAGTELGQPALNVTGDLQIIARPAAALDLLNPQITTPPVAGGTGAFTVTVRNTGGQPSTGGEPVTIDLPDGFTPQQILVGEQTCSTAGEAAARVAVDCALPVIEPGADVLISVDLRVAPGTKVGTATVSIPNTEPLSVTLTVERGIIGLAGEAPRPLVPDGRPHDILITATLNTSVIDPGVITFTTTNPGITFQPSPDCDVAAECELFGDNNLLLTVTIAPGARSGPLVIAGTELGQPALIVTGNLAIPTIQSPPDLTLSEVDVIQPLVAGGNGRLAMTVQNTGDVATGRQPISIDGPTGITLADIVSDPGDAVTCTEDGCFLASLPAGSDPVTLKLSLSVAATLADDPSARVTVVIGDKATTPLPIGVQSGVDSVAITPADPLVANGQPASRTVTVTPVSGVENPGPITLTIGGSATFGTTEGCETSASRKAITCSATVFDVDITVPRESTATEVQITAVDAGQRALDVKGSPLQVEVVTAASLVITTVDVTETPVAGGEGAFTVSVINRGGSASPGGEAIDLQLPEGISRTGTIIPGGSCSGTGQPALALAAAVPDCTLPSIPAGQSLTLTFSVHISPTVGTTASGTVAIGGGDPADFTFTVLPGVTTLTVSSGSEVIADGAAHPVTFTAGLAGGVTEPGAVTFTAGRDVALSCGEKPAATAVCDLGENNTIQLLVTVSPDRQPGDLMIAAIDDGSRSLPTIALPVVAPARLELSDLTAPPSTIAGSTAAITLTVTNTGGSRSTGTEIIDTVLPNGFKVSGVDAGSSPLCSTTGPNCLLPQIDAKASTTLTITFAVPTSTKPGDYQVTMSVAGQKRVATLKVQTGVRTPLELSDLTIIQRPIEGTAVLSLTVTNTSSVTSPKLPITVTPLLTAVLISGPTGSSTPLCALGIPCQLPALAPGQTVKLTIYVAAPLTGKVTVSIDGTTRSAQIVGQPEVLTATLGPTVTITPTPPQPPAGEAPATAASVAEPPTTRTPLAETESTPDTAADPAVTVTTTPTPTTDDPASTGPIATDSSTATRATTPESSTAVETPTTVDSPPAATPVTESAGTPTPETTDSITTSTEEPATAALSISDAAIEQALAAGTAGRIAVTVTNSGDGRSAEQPVRITLPDGVTTSRVTVDGGVVAAGAVQTCTLPELDPGASVTVTIEITASEDATGGTAVITVDGSAADGLLTIDRPAIPETPLTSPGTSTPAVRENESGFGR